MEKSGSQKALKVITIIWIVLAIITIIGSIMLAAGGGLVAGTVASGQVDLTDTGMTGDSAVAMGAGLVFVGILGIIVGVVDLIIAIFGLRGANHPEKIGVFFVLCIIGLIVGVIMAVYTAVQGAGAGAVFSSALSGCLWPIICLVLANNIKKQVR